MNFNFGEVLTRAWQIIWKYKVLWIFGFLASCGRGGGGTGSNSSWSTDQNNFQQGGLPPQAIQWFNYIEEHAIMIITACIALVCIFWILAVFLGTIGRIGLIRGTAQADGGAEKIIFGQLFSESMPYFWRMFGLSLIVALPALVLVGALFAGILVFAVSAGNGNVASIFGILGMIPLFFGCMCLFIPVMFVIGVIIRQSQNAIVLEDMDILPSISRGWDVFRNNLGPIILMAILLGLIGFVVGLVITLPIFLIVFPTIFAFIIGRGESFAPLIFMGICICIYIPVAWVLQSILISYTESAWTLTYMRLTQKPGDSNDAKPETIDPVEPEDNNRTIIASRPNA